ncbi:hypothetical protein ACH4F6_34610 [Streptomyces sp. NPDC017936]|uniref:hypothetical protein n=1 Tax=Streptomyces sp. NPDC017936 TaxID=3365016 RepID=UPI0037A711BC
MNRFGLIRTCEHPASSGPRPDAQQKADRTVSQETPIFSRLVAERGDVPAQVRGEADRIRRDLAQVLPWTPASDLPTRPAQDGRRP